MNISAVTVILNNYFKLSHVFCFCVIGLSLSAITSDALKLPSAFNVVPRVVSTLIQSASKKIINTAEERAQELLNTVIFDRVVNENDLNILQYKENGIHTRHSLGSGDISIDPSHKIVIIVHGYRSSGNVDWVQKMARAYQEKGVKNTLALDWGNISAGSYITACGSTKPIGKAVAIWLYEHILKYDISMLQQVHLVGHSLGAHVCGFIGSTIYNMTGTLIGRISGLDAAAPLFERPAMNPPFLRLDSSDASYVDGYHTSIELAGFKSPIGHQDFYINSGYQQPGCDKSEALVTIPTDVWTCSHQRSYEIFINSISSNRYLATKCKNVTSPKLITCNANVSVVMGDGNNGTNIIYGEFFVKTDSEGKPDVWVKPWLSRGIS